MYEFVRLPGVSLATHNFLFPNTCNHLEKMKKWIHTWSKIDDFSTDYLSVNGLLAG